MSNVEFIFVIFKFNVDFFIQKRRLYFQGITLVSSVFTHVFIILIVHIYAIYEMWLAVKITGLDRMARLVKKSKLHIFPLPVVLYINLDCFGVSCRMVELSAIEMSAFSPMAFGLWCSKRQKNYIWKTQQKCLLPEIMTRLVNIIHRPCCAQFHVATVFVCTKLHPTSVEESIHLLMDERLWTLMESASCS